MMSSKVGAVKFVERKNCFVTLSTNLASVYGQYLRGKKFVILTLDFGTKHILTTWHGDTTRIGNDSVEISGLFANRLGIQDGAQVVISVTRHLPTCSSVLVEPVSVDDWEILELHAAYIESHLLDQTRILWNGEVLPIWLQGNICVFVHIKELQPHHPCTLLEVDSQIVVLPRDRFNAQQQSEEQEKPTGALHKNGRVNGHDNTCNTPQSLTEENPDLNQEEILNREVQSDSYLSLFSRMRNGLYWLMTDGPYAPSLREELVCHTVGKDVQISVRIQAYFQSLLLEPMRPRFDSKNPKSRSPPPVATPLSIQNHCSQSPEQLALCQPYTICICRETLSELCDLDLRHGEMFLAVVHKLWSPKEQGERKKLAVRSNSSSSSNGSSGGDNSPPLMSLVEVTPQIVRCVAYDCCNERGLVLPGHVMVQDFMRQCCHLDVTGRVVLQTVTTAQRLVKGLSLVPDYGGRAKLDEGVILLAFKHWLSQCSSLQCPLLVSDGLVINVPLTNNTLIACEVRVDFVDGSPAHSSTSPAPSAAAPPPFGLICGEIVDDLVLRVASSKPQTKRRTSMKVLSDLDPKVPTMDVKRLGGVSRYLETAVHYLEFCLSVKPLSDLLLSENVKARALLVTGEKGVGKSGFTRLLCDNFVNVPHLAYTQVIECKALRGKTSESIHNCLIRAYDEAKWRQPAILVLDDLDLIAAASSGPEQELSGEAMYYARVAEVIKDLLKTIVYERTRIVVVAAARGQKSLHPALVSSRGINFFEKCVNIDRPNQEERREIIQCLMEATPTIDPQTMRTLNLDQLAKKMDGFVAKDIRRLLDRAVHAHLKSSNESFPMVQASPSKISSRSKRQVLANHSVRLRMADFEAALENFTMLSLRDVSLHKVEEDIRWEDVGGLQEVKTILQETLLWPMKYPELFAKAPLRLRTGILLYGAPGSGKTLLARAVAKECGLNFISIKGPELLNKFIGASEQAVRDTFSRAQSAKPCILFFDEFDSLAPRRGHDSTGVTDRVVNQFLTQLDGFETLEGVYVLAATSRPDMIDPALLRPGRLDRCIYCPLPDEPSRQEILQALSRRLTLSEDVVLQQIGHLADNFTGADLKALLYNAQLIAVHRQLDSLKRRSKQGSNLSTNLLNDELQEKLAKYATQLSNTSSTSYNASSSELASSRGTSNDASGDTGFFDADLETDEAAIPEEIEWRMPRLKVLAKSRDGSLESEDLISTRSSSMWSEVSPLSTPSDRLSLSSHSSYRPTVVTHADLVTALEAMTPSVPPQERVRYQKVYDSFRGIGGGRRKSFSLPGDALMDNKVTLA